MTIEIGATSPPHRETGVAEFHVRHDGFIDVPAEVYCENGVLMIGLYAREAGIQWEYSLAEFVEAIGRAMVIVEAK